MEPAAEELVIVSRCGTEQQCTELSLVLTAGGIEHRRLYDAARAGWVIAVAAAHAERAAAELAAYRAEQSQRIRPPRPPLQEFGGAWFGVGGYAAVLMLVATWTRQFAFGFEWLTAGRLEAGQVLAGEWWRSVTALTLHVDTGHLAGNVGFGSFFGYFIGRYFGPGVGWLAILAAGTFGNLLNAVIQSADHRSIGASTAVFGALGLLTAHTWRRGAVQASWRARVAPLIAGIGLLAFTGTGGENTDIFAHLTGFAAGFGIGALLEKLLLPRSASLQVLCGVAAIVIVALAWIFGIAAAG